jgi:RecG-like helicase
MKNKQTAVEWLIEQLTEVDYNCINKTFLQINNSLAGYKMRELFEKAKEMEKQQIMDAFQKGQESTYKIT